MVFDGYFQLAVVVGQSTEVKVVLVKELFNAH